MGGMGRATYLVLWDYDGSPIYLDRQHGERVVWQPQLRWHRVRRTLFDDEYLNYSWEKF